MRHLMALAILQIACIGTVTAQTDSFKVGGVTRSFIVHAPSGLSNPPLVISMHGMSGSGSQQRSMTGFDKIADREKFIVAYPDGINARWDISGSTDVNFILALIDTMAARFQIDRNRVYATGFSMGGMMSYKLACVAADKFAAIGPAAGYLMGGMGGGGCTPKRPMPILHIHGSLDTIVDFSGLASYISGWVTKNGCPAAAQITKPYPQSKPDSKVTKAYYGLCDQGGEIIVLTVEGMSHAYPGSFGSQDISASEEFWEFFKTHSLGPVKVARQSAGTPKPFQVSASYRAGSIHLQSRQGIVGVRVLDIQGKVLLHWKTDGDPVNAVTVLVNRTAGGVYLLSVLSAAGHKALSVVGT